VGGVFLYWLTAKCVNWKDDLAVFRTKGLILRNLKLNSFKKSMQYEPGTEETSSMRLTFMEEMTDVL